MPARGVAAVGLVWVVLPINDCFGYGWDTSWFGSTYIVQSICKGPDPVHGEVGVQELTLGLLVGALVGFFLKHQVDEDHDRKRRAASKPE